MPSNPSPAAGSPQESLHPADDTRAALPRVPLGSSGMLLPRVGFGTHALHRLLSGTARQELLRLSYDLGIRYFDTAPSYGAGLAEREIGRFGRGRRPDLVLATKFGIAPDLAAALPGGAYLRAAAGAVLRTLRLRRAASGGPPRDFSALAMERSIEGSLRRLRTDCIDVLYLHAPTPASLTDPEPLIEALSALRRAGKVRWVGLSGEASPCLALARRYPALADVLQIELTAGAGGLPDAAPLPAAAAVGLWEFPGPRSGSPAGGLAQLWRRLQQAVPAGVVLLSTPRKPVIRSAVDFFTGEPSPARPG